MAVDEIWSTGLRFNARLGHPDWTGWVSFNFTQDVIGHRHLQVNGAGARPTGQVGCVASLKSLTMLGSRWSKKLLAPESRPAIDSISCR
jgi:hypothetical protein